MESNPPPVPGHPYADSTPPQTSGLAITSLVLGILGFCSAGLTGIPAVICGHIALGNIGKSAGRQTGGGMAIGGLVTGYLSLVIGFIAVLAGMALPVFAQVRERATLTQALSQAKMIATACQIYAGDHEGKFPPKLQDLVPEYLPDAAMIECPYPNSKKPVAFEYFGGSEKDDPRKVLLASPAIPGKGRVLVYVDGRAEAKSRQQIKRGD